jgi:hypothetical protein
MTNPYLAASGADGTTGGDREQYQARDFKELGTVHQGVIIGQSPWLTDKWGNPYRIINLQNGEEKFSIFAKSKGQLRAIGDATMSFKTQDTLVGDVFALKWSESIPTDKGNDYKKYTAVVQRTNDR